MIPTFDQTLVMVASAVSQQVMQTMSNLIKISEQLLGEIIDAIEHVENQYRDNPQAYCPRWAMNGEDWDERKDRCRMADTLRWVVKLETSNDRTIDTCTHHSG